MTNWKTLAIILAVILLLQSLLLIYFWNMGGVIIDNENICSINVCADDDFYDYDTYTKICSCYKGTDLAKQEYMGG